MTYAPPQLTSLGAYWREQGGVMLGIVGDAAHSSGYHCGRDRIYGAGGLGDADYSVRTMRDRAGLTDAASAIDLGKLDGSLRSLRRFSIWLVNRCRAGAEGSRDIREVIYSPDGVEVYGWSREAGPASLPILDYGDASHLTHTHISYYRDSEARDKRPLIRPFFVTEDTMPAFDILDSVPYVLTVNDVPGHLIIALDDTTVRDPIAAGATKYGHAKIRLHKPLDTYPGDRRTGWLVQHTIDGLSRASFLLAVDVVAVAVPVVSQGDVDAAVDANEAKWERWVATHP